MDKEKTIIIMGAVGSSCIADVLARIDKEFGKDTVVLSEDEAKQKGLIPNIKQEPFIFKALPEFKMPIIDYKQESKNDCKKGWRK